MGPNTQTDLYSNSLQALFTEVLLLVNAGNIKTSGKHGRMWQRTYGFFDCTHVCRTTRRKVSLFHQILIVILQSFRNNENVHKCLVQKKGRLIFFELSHSLKLFFTFKIFHVFNIVPIYKQRMLEGVLILCEWSYC